jgi:hypothetical protein
MRAVGRNGLSMCAVGGCVVVRPGASAASTSASFVVRVVEAATGEERSSAGVRKRSAESSHSITSHHKRSSSSIFVFIFIFTCHQTIL